MRHFNIEPHYSLELVNTWYLVWNYQRSSPSFPITDEKVLTVKIWESSAFDKRNQSTLNSMFAYAEVSDEADGELWHQSFFGEKSGHDAFKWANEKADKELN